MSSVGKRTDREQPLTEHDVADRLDKAALRVLRIMMDARQLGLMKDIKLSRYLTNALSALRAELDLWEVDDAQPLRDVTDVLQLPKMCGVRDCGEDIQWITGHGWIHTRTGLRQCDIVQAGRTLTYARPVVPEES